ncbi:hypothetical protein WA026_007834 [Henosepilachna vigintioctopunctata]|uniref:Uncharacterized protein n=1 Tax=Henosepilachna vigintioctopunctata TaxID=420089 RepID=A0AAW1TV55_9CUCU
MVKLLATVFILMCVIGYISCTHCYYCRDSYSCQFPARMICSTPYCFSVKIRGSMLKGCTSDKYVCDKKDNMGNFLDICEICEEDFCNTRKLD